METFFKGKKQEQVAKKSCEIIFVGNKAKFTW